jgi:tripartite-type tricarboxylate transporter receptor subunit TctC
LFKKLTGVNIVHIPYRGTIFAVTDVMGGRLHMVFSDMPIALPHAQSGKIRALAVTGAKRTPLVPDMPTVAEAGVPGYVIENAWGVVAPKGVAASILAQLNKEIVRVHNLPDVKARYATLGLEAVSSTPAAYAAIIRSDTAKYSRLIKETGAKAD